jgi:hypothetical protein
MKKSVHKLAGYIALVLISALPLSVDVLAEDNKKNRSFVLSDIDKSMVTVAKCKLPAEKQL